jgi:hypothetical protein
MDRVNELTAIVRREVADYANARGWKAKIYSVEDEKRHIYTVIDVPDKDHPLVSKAGVIVMAHIENDKVIIDEDITDRPLYEALEEAGIPREQIILAYAGEKLPDEKEQAE